MLIEYKKADICQVEGKPVLSQVDFHADEGEFIYIIGKVGSGKSSLLKTIYFELDIDKAEEAVVLGQNLLTIKRKHIPALRRQMGIIFQDFQLLGDRTVYRNLQFVLKATGWKNKKEIDKRIADVLADVGMEDKADKMPHELSGGEQQRIAIARAILNKPRLIVADEPTGNLDPETAESIIKLLREISLTGTAVVMSTHNMPLLDKYPGIVYRCVEGRLEEITSDFNRYNYDAAETEQPGQDMQIVQAEQGGQTEQDGQALQGGQKDPDGQEEPDGQPQGEKEQGDGDGYGMREDLSV